MPFWSGEKLLANQHVISDFSPDRVDCNSYTLRMGNCYYVTPDSEAKEAPTKIFLNPGHPFSIPPGQFGYLLSKEVVTIPHDTMAFISMRTGIKWQGLINVSGFHVDPGYKGKLIYAVYNASPSPVQLCENDPVFKIWFASLDRESGPEHIFKQKAVQDISNELIRGMSREIFSLQSIAEKIRNLQPTIDQLTFIWRAIIIGVVAAVILSFLAFALPTIANGPVNSRFIMAWETNARAPSPNW
jgi:dCTP deaminase